jgi:hypothetical protein
VDDRSSTTSRRRRPQASEVRGLRDRLRSTQVAWSHRWSRARPRAPTVTAIARAGHHHHRGEARTRPWRSTWTSDVGEARSTTTRTSASSERSGLRAPGDAEQNVEAGTRGHGLLCHKLGAQPVSLWLRGGASCKSVRRVQGELQEPALLGLARAADISNENIYNVNGTITTEATTGRSS